MKITNRDQLSIEQQIIHDQILKLGKNDKFLVEAKGGCGKSTILGIAISNIFAQKEDANILLIAPTHVAKDTLINNLTDCLSPAQLGRCDFATSAKASGRTLKKDIETGRLDSLRRGSILDDIIEYDLIAIDEISAVPFKDIRPLFINELAILLPEDYKSIELELPPIVLMGDRIQTRAVREKQSPIFDFADQNLIESAKLMKSHRNHGPISDFADKCRKEAYLPTSIDATDDGQIQVFANVSELANDFLNALANQRDLGNIAYATQNMAWLSYTNDDVSEMANRARQVLYGDISKENWQIGEYIRVLGNIEGATNGMILKIISQTSAPFMFSTGIEIKAHQTTFLHEPTNTHYFSLLPDYCELDRLEALIENCQNEGDKAKAIGDFSQAMWWWGERNILQDAFASVQSPLAMTILRSQSRTIDHVWVNTRNANRYAACKKNVLYTGYSRARQTLRLVDCADIIIQKEDVYMMFFKYCKSLDIPAPSRKRFAQWQEIAGTDKDSVFAYGQGHIDYWVSKKK